MNKIMIGLSVLVAVLTASSVAAQDRHGFNRGGVGGGGRERGGYQGGGYQGGGGGLPGGGGYDRGGYGGAYGRSSGGQPDYRVGYPSGGQRGYADPYPGARGAYAQPMGRGAPGRPGGGNHGYSRGQFLPPGGGAVADPRLYHLRRPPNGYGWVTVGPNAYLTQRSTGMILDTAPLY